MFCSLTSKPRSRDTEGYMLKDGQLGRLRVSNMRSLGSQALIPCFITAIKHPPHSSTKETNTLHSSPLKFLHLKLFSPQITFTAHMMWRVFRLLYYEEHKLEC